MRTVQTFENVTLESAPSAPACLTPLDKFPPAAPKGLRAVAEDGAVSLVWDQNAEADLGGYLVLRGEAPGDTLAPLTPQPIADANYRDTTVKPGVTIRLRRGRRGHGDAEEPERPVAARRSDGALIGSSSAGRFGYDRRARGDLSEAHESEFSH